MRSLLALLPICAALLNPALARAQVESEAAAAPVDDRPALKLNEVERGLFVGAAAGGLVLFGPSARSGSGLSTGRSVALTVGGDLGELLSVGVMLLGAQVSTPSGFVSSNDMSGDFSTLMLGAMARVSLLGRPDANLVRRFFVSVRGGAGAGLMGPKNFYRGSDVIVFGGAGLEYFTRLRHFSIGLDADFLFGLSHVGPGVMVSPSLRYTF